MAKNTNTNPNNTGYKATISECSKELDARERIRTKDVSDAIKLDDATQDVPSIDIDVDYYAVLDIYNEKSDSKEYKNYIVVAKDGTKYVTGSDSFFKSFMDIVAELAADGIEDFTIKVFRHDSKNYAGKQFIICSLA